VFLLLLLLVLVVFLRLKKERPGLGREHGCRGGLAEALPHELAGRGRARDDDLGLGPLWRLDLFLL